MAKEWRCAVVGTGVVGEWHVRIIPAVPGAKLVAVCDVSAARCQKALDVNKMAGVGIYTDAREMLKHERVDVVHVCTPSGDHLDTSLAALEAGANVITEKPLEIQLDRVDRMIEAAQKHGVKIAGIFQNRWHEANRALKKAADEGRFGRIAWAGSFTPWYRTDAYYQEGGWRGTWKLDGGGAVMNQSIHAIDLLQWIVGPVKQVSAYAASRIHGTIEVEDTLSCALQFENGAFGSIVGSTAMYPGMPVRIEVGGEHGTAVSENGLKTFKFRDERDDDKALRDRLSPPVPEGVEARIKGHGGPELFNQLFEKKTGPGGASGATDVKLDLHGRNLHAILQSWEAGLEAETSGTEARKSVAIVLAMYESARKNGAPVEVK